MSLWLLLACVVAAWAVLAVFAGERSQRLARIRLEHELLQAEARKPKRRA